MWKKSLVLEQKFADWLASPQQNAAGRIGLYRILFSLYMLWFYSHLQFREMSLLPTESWNPILLLALFHAPPSYIYGILEPLLIASLVFLLVGYKTRIATILVLLLGSILAGIRVSLFMPEHQTIITAFFVPFLMMFSAWGETYSIDSILKKRRGELIPNPKDSAWQYFWPCRGILIILAFLFFSSALHKFVNLSWIINPHFVGNLMADKTVSSYLQNGFPISPLAIFISHHPLLHIPMQYGALIFETLSILILFSALARSIFFYLAPLFHLLNTILLGIPFISVIGIYLAFPDWQTFYQRFYPQRLRLNWINQLPAVMIVTTTWLLAAAIALSWNTLPFTRYLFGWGDWVTYHTIWFFIVPIVLFRLCLLLKESRGVLSKSGGTTLKM